MKQTLKEMIEEEKRKENEELFWECCMNLWYDTDSAGDR